MTKRNKAFRIHKEQAKWIRRVKYYMPKTPQLMYNPDRVEFWYPDINECLDEKGFKMYKDTGTPCSCPMCSHLKYDRGKIKRETRNLLKEYERGQSPLFLCE